MATIDIKIYPSVSISELAERIVLITEGLYQCQCDRAGNIKVPVGELEPGRWQLGAGNNFWLYDKGHNQYSLSARYWTFNQLMSVKSILKAVNLCIDE
jgi:hypothetical protein